MQNVPVYDLHNLGKLRPCPFYNFFRFKRLFLVFLYYILTQMHSQVRIFGTNWFIESKLKVWMIVVKAWVSALHVSLKLKSQIAISQLVWHTRLVINSGKLSGNCTYSQPPSFTFIICAFCVCDPVGPHLTLSVIMHETHMGNGHGGNMEPMYNPTYNLYFNPCSPHVVPTWNFKLRPWWVLCMLPIWAPPHTQCNPAGNSYGQLAWDQYGTCEKTHLLLIL